MLDSLALLVITFIVMSVVSVIGVVLALLTKNAKLKKALVYFLAVWGMVIAFCNVQTVPIYMTGGVVLAWAIGALGAAALLIMLCSKSEKKLAAARVLAVVSVVAGMIDCFLI